MARCEYCQQEMTPGTGCTLKQYTDLGPIPLDRIPYGDSDFCHDCGVKNGQLHHPGCDVETCPKCNGQAIGCGCADDQEFEDEEIEEDEDFWDDDDDDDDDDLDEY